MVELLERRRGAAAILGPALEPGATPSHAYLFHGPGGAGKREVAREFAARLLAQGAVDPASAQARALAGVHPDLTWVAPSGAHEILVSDIDEPVVAAATRTPFEASRRVFVIESAEQLGAEAANRLLKTLEEPAAFVHIILIAERLADVLATVRSRCQPVSFQAPGVAELAATLRAQGAPAALADAAARLCLGDGRRARELVGEQGVALREHAQALARATLAGAAASSLCEALLGCVCARGELLQAELEARADQELELLPSRERKRVQAEWAERGRRARRRLETAQLELALDVVESWFMDLMALSCGAGELVRNRDRGAELEADSGLGRGADLRALALALELVEDTRQRLRRNVSEDLALEALSHRLTRTLAG
jgi:DNA polymerase-3 subunit delta'